MSGLLHSLLGGAGVAIVIVVAIIWLVVRFDRWLTRYWASLRRPSTEVVRYAPPRPQAARGEPIDPKWALQVVAVAAQEWRRHEMEAGAPGRGTTP